MINTRSEEKFVNYRSIFPTEWPANLKLNRSTLLEKLNKCSISTDILHTTKLVLDKENEIRLLADDNVVDMNLVMPASYSGTIKGISINYDKLTKLMSQIDCEEVEFAIHDIKRAIVITTEDPSYKGLMMPMAQK